MWINILKIVLKLYTGYQHLAESLKCFICNTGCNTEIHNKDLSFLGHGWKLFLFPGIISLFKIGKILKREIISCYAVSLKKNCCSVPMETCLWPYPKYTIGVNIVSSLSLYLYISPDSKTH